MELSFRVHEGAGLQCRLSKKKVAAFPLLRFDSACALSWPHYAAQDALLDRRQDIAKRHRHRRRAKPLEQYRPLAKELIALKARCDLVAVNCDHCGHSNTELWQQNDIVNLWLMAAPLRGSHANHPDVRRCRSFLQIISCHSSFGVAFKTEGACHSSVPNEKYTLLLCSRLLPNSWRRT